MPAQYNNPNIVRCTLAQYKQLLNGETVKGHTMDKTKYVYVVEPEDTGGVELFLDVTSNNGNGTTIPSDYNDVIHPFTNPIVDLSVYSYLVLTIKLNGAINPYEVIIVDLKTIPAGWGHHSSMTDYDFMIERGTLSQGQFSISNILSGVSYLQRIVGYK